MTYRIGWFSTGRGQGSRDLLTAVYKEIQQGSLRTGVSFVFSNREPGEAAGSDQFFNLVTSYRLPLVTFSSRKFLPDRKRDSREHWRILYDREIMYRLEAFSFDIGVLAGYMLVAGPEMCQKYDMINLHPAAPGGPTGTWQEVIWTLIEARAESTGVMIHLVTPELDKGPAVAHCTYSIRGAPFDIHWKQIAGRSVEEIRRAEGEDNQLFRLIRQQGTRREIPLLVSTIKAFSEGGIKIVDKAVVDRKGTRIDSYDLTPEIERILGQQHGRTSQPH